MLNRPAAYWIILALLFVAYMGVFYILMKRDEARTGVKKSLLSYPRGHLFYKDVPWSEKLVGVAAFAFLLFSILSLPKFLAMTNL